MLNFLGGCEGAEWGARGGLYLGTALGNPAAGAVIGGIAMGTICGVGASYLAYNGTQNVAQDPGALYNSLTGVLIDFYPYIAEMISVQTGDSQNPLLHEGARTNVDKLNLPQTSIAVGAAHNVILRDLQNGGLASTRIDTSPIGNSANINLVSTIIQDAEMQDFCVSYFNAIQTNTSVVSESLPGKVMEIYYDLIQSSSVDESVIADYINNYYSIVSESNELTDTEKECIYIGLAVSLFSFNYWEEYGLFE